MADLENKKADAPEKKPKKKSDKPSFWARMGAFFKSVKSEFKKITWSSANDVRKNTIVVLVLLAACALALGIVDYVFTKGIEALGYLI